MQQYRLKEFSSSHQKTFTPKGLSTLTGNQIPLVKELMLLLVRAIYTASESPCIFIIVPKGN